MHEIRNSMGFMFTSLARKTRATKLPTRVTNDCRPSRDRRERCSTPRLCAASYLLTGNMDKFDFSIKVLPIWQESQSGKNSLFRVDSSEPAEVITPSREGEDSSEHPLVACRSQIVSQSGLGFAMIAREPSRPQHWHRTPTVRERDARAIS